MEGAIKISHLDKKSPYLKSEKYVPGDLSFEGILYKDVKMRLDL